MMNKECSQKQTANEVNGFTGSRSGPKYDSGAERCMPIPAIFWARYQSVVNCDSSDMGGTPSRSSSSTGKAGSALSSNNESSGDCRDMTSAESARPRARDAEANSWFCPLVDESTCILGGNAVRGIESALTLKAAGSLVNDTDGLIIRLLLVLLGPWSNVLGAALAALAVTASFFL
jgi:hypothetical protein